MPISIDTTKSIVAEKALEAGAHIVNDVWAYRRILILPELCPNMMLE